MTRGKQGRQGKKKSDYDAKTGPLQTPYDTIIKENPLFEKYYKQLGLFDEAEWDVFIETLRKPLPITFRITGYKSFAKEILDILKEKHFKYLDEVTRNNPSEVIGASMNKASSLLAHSAKANEVGLDGKSIYKCLSWYPGEVAWEIELSRNDVRKNVHFEEFKQFLIHQTENGNINRQEAVSMIPPLLLDVQPHHKILDMCASPGSKTAQLIEFLHQDKSNPIPDGLVIANDLDNKRCYMLMHQLKRLESPNFMIINHDASALPNMRCGGEGDVPLTNIVYDRILCDVPCSGDGTFRKNIDIWTKWNPAHACNLHGIQSRIARRAVELLQYGGVMVYSTCSLNPVENEAIVYNLLLKFKDQIELVDVSGKLAGLKTAPGLYSWNIMTKTGELFEKPEQAAASPYANLIRPNMFPPDAAVAQELHLERCLRILPHHQNTGGFFIAVIRKLPLNQHVTKLLDSTKIDQTTKVAGEEQAPETAAAGEQTEQGPPEADSRKMKAPPAKRLKHVYDENPFSFFSDENPLLTDWLKIKAFFKISEEFPTTQMLTRNRKGENVRNVYFVSKQIRELALNNGDRIKFINMGVPLFSKAEIKDPSQVELRICQESIDIVQKYFGNRNARITSRDDLLTIIKNSNPLLVDLSAEFQEEMKLKCNSEGGSMILSYQLKDAAAISFTAWLGKASVRPLINTQLRSFYMSLLGIDESEINETCKKIKEEDQINSQRSRELNPQYIAKHGPPKPKVEPAPEAESTAAASTE